MIQKEIHTKIVDHCEATTDWFQNKTKGFRFPVYSSFDIRDSNYKVVPVDANIFPAGFNNICPTDLENAPEILHAYLEKNHPGLSGKLIGLLTEEHSSSSYYWENVAVLQELFQTAGYEIQVCIPSLMNEPKQITTVKGRSLTIYGTSNRNGFIFANDKKLDLIICNNDFSVRPENWSGEVLTPMNPPLQLGWYQRRKYSFFQIYNELAKEFAQLIHLEPHKVTIETELFTEFDANDPDSLERLAQRVDSFLERLKKSYAEYRIDHAPFCFIKNNMGTYGLGVVKVQSGDEIRSWNSKMRSKMKASKGGNRVDSVLIQEGVPTHFKDDSGATAEPCIYLVGNELVGGFLRTHSEKNQEDNLNSPGAVFKRLCVSDLEIDRVGCPMENVYGWTSKLAMLAVAREAELAAR